MLVLCRYVLVGTKTKKNAVKIPFSSFLFFPVVISLFPREIGLHFAAAAAAAGSEEKTCCRYSLRRRKEEGVLHAWCQILLLLLPLIPPPG